MIEVTGLIKRYEDTVAVDGLFIDLRRRVRALGIDAFCVRDAICPYIVA